MHVTIIHKISNDQELQEVVTLWCGLLEYNQIFTVDNATHLKLIKGFVKQTG